MKYWLDLGINKSKLVFGIPTYGSGFRLLTKYMHFTYAPAIGGSIFGNNCFYYQVFRVRSDSLDLPLIIHVQ
jgi:hypothetical protein